MTHRIALLLLGLALATCAAAAEIPAGQSMWIGGDVDISRPVEGRLVAVGGSVTVKAPVHGDVRAAGGDVHLDSTATITGDVALAGGRITLDGPIQGNLRAAGGHVEIDGPVTGDASVAAGTLELGPAARIEGSLVFHGGELHRDPAAQVIGGIEQAPHRWRVHERLRSEPFLHGWIWTAGLLVLAALIAAALPDASRRMAQELRERPWITPLLGLLALTSIPIGALLLIVTIIGIPVAVLALIGYVALLLLAYAWVAVVAGGMLLDRVKPEIAARTAWRVWAAVLAMLVLAILAHAPFVGGLVKLAALVVGVGMIVAAIFRQSQPAQAHPT
ncbi:MAG TPA: polymer-forming cytoskeletal protein [Usitatibacter sp.]|nr:polymer-forming cytoskeletal protein [Usitatibacter sp.]